MSTQVHKLSQDWGIQKAAIGIPFNDSTNWRLAIAENAQAIIGDNLLGMQAGNEPDYYARYT